MSITPGIMMFHAAWGIAHSAGAVLATPTQAEVFKSIQTNVDEPATGGNVLPFLMAGGAVLILFALFTQRRKRQTSPRGMNHQGKLLKEVLKTVPIRSAEIKQLKLLVEGSDGETRPSSPLTLLICPSLLTVAIRNRPVKTDAKVLRELSEKLGISEPPVAKAPRPSPPKSRAA